ncbi:unnamed protein product [Hydatigera taeniaeformis]|uniref:Uncharacterized protein n=1 Tax=Hydatigena taeniaeformis TaxID=6205 RepID=A0A0R3X6A9_HYDTA|nr:unnamed protein product [Hydatigera taeniaeformis]
MSLEQCKCLPRSYAPVAVVGSPAPTPEEEDMFICPTDASRVDPTTETEGHWSPAASSPFSSSRFRRHACLGFMFLSRTCCSSLVMRVTAC